MTQEELIINWSDKILNHLLKLKEEKYPDLTFWLRKQDSERLRKGFWFQGSHYIFLGLVNKGDWKNKTRQAGLVYNFLDVENPSVSWPPILCTKSVLKKCSKTCLSRSTDQQK